MYAIGDVYEKSVFKHKFSWLFHSNTENVLPISINIFIISILEIKVYYRNIVYIVYMYFNVSIIIIIILITFVLVCI